MDPSFWNDRFGRPAFVYGEAPNAFVAAQAHRFAPGASVVDVGAGEGRNAAFLAARGCRVTAVDYAAEGLAKAQRLAADAGAALEVVEADVTAWTPARRWDGAVCTFLHLPPERRPALYAVLQRVLTPGGVLVAEWFRPAHRARGLHGGPPAAALMITADELRSHFPAEGFVQLSEEDVVLDEGPGHQGEAAVVRLVWTG